jgi:hypothetical protein
MEAAFLFARIFMGMADDSPAPWGEGQIEGGRSALASVEYEN